MIYKGATFQSEGVYTPDQLVIEGANGYKGVIASGSGVLARGTVLGKITASGKFTKATAAAADGSQIADVILADDVDATAADAEAVVYSEGRFAQAHIILGAGLTLAAVHPILRTKDIHLESTIPA